MPNFTELPIEIARSKRNCIIELKVDGSRLTFDGQNLISDRNCIRNDRFRHIFDEVRKLDWQVRGEIAVPNGNVLQLNKAENWHKARFYVFDIFAWKGIDFRSFNAFQNRSQLECYFKSHSFKHLELPLSFSTFQDGWDYVEKNNAEGLVLKEALTSYQWKVKRLIEEKLPIVGYEQGKAKGAFIIERNGVRSKVSALGVKFVSVYQSLKQQGIVPYAEIEYTFLSEYGVPFQPRLRRLGSLEQLKS